MNWNNITHSCRFLKYLFFLSQSLSNNRNRQFSEIYTIINKFFSYVLKYLCPPLITPYLHIIIIWVENWIFHCNVLFLFQSVRDSYKFWNITKYISLMRPWNFLSHFPYARFLDYLCSLERFLMTPFFNSSSRSYAVDMWSAYILWYLFYYRELLLSLSNLHIYYYLFSLHR